MRINRQFRLPFGWNIKLLLRLLLAIIFALPAFIFSEVVPDLKPFNHNMLRVIITFWFGLLGYGVFPELAERLTRSTLSVTNLLIARLSNEVMSQMLRLSRQSNPLPSMNASSPIGGVTVNMPMVLDTSAIIDGRILDIAKTGFLFGTILVPNFILTELQQVSDSSDYLKRTRGRRGFEIVEDLKKVKNIRIEIWDKDNNGKTVDEKLIKLAKALHSRIITTDFNLNKVASLSNVLVLNVNDLANAVKTITIPGEKLTVKIVHLGKDPKQGIGYLPDGTMIVVEDGATLVGQEVRTEVSRVLQVPAGRMIFTKKAKES